MAAGKMLERQHELSAREAENVANIAFAADVPFDAVAARLQELARSGWTAAAVYAYVLRNGKMPEVSDGN